MVARVVSMVIVSRGTCYQAAGGSNNLRCYPTLRVARVMPMESRSCSHRSPMSRDTTQTLRSLLLSVLLLLLLEEKEEEEEEEEEEKEEEGGGDLITGSIRA